MYWNKKDEGGGGGPKGSDIQDRIHRLPRTHIDAADALACGADAQNVETRRSFKAAHSDGNLTVTFAARLEREICLCTALLRHLLASSPPFFPFSMRQFDPALAHPPRSVRPA